MAIQSLEHFICDNIEISGGFRVRIYTEFVFNAQIIIQGSIYRKRFKQLLYAEYNMQYIGAVSVLCAHFTSGL